MVRLNMCDVNGLIGLICKKIASRSDIALGLCGEVRSVAFFANALCSYLLSSMETIWPATGWPVTSMYSTVAFMPSIPLQGSRSPVGT